MKQVVAGTAVYSVKIGFSGITSLTLEDNKQTSPIAG